MKASRTIDLTVFSNSMIRLWMRTQAHVMPHLRLFSIGESADAGEPIAMSRDFGFRTQTLYVRIGDEAEVRHTGTIRVAVEFYYHAAPQFGSDYNDCAEKHLLETFELYFALFPDTVAESMSKCTQEQLDSTPVNRLPPGKVTLGSQPYYLSKDFFITQADMKLNVPSATTVGNPAEPMSAHPVPAQDKGPIIGVSEDLQSIVNAAFNTTVIFPAGSEDGSVLVHVKYNLNLMNFRVALFASNQTSPLALGMGTPFSNQDERYNAEGYLFARNLAPSNVYFVSYMESNAGTVRRSDIVCLPLHVRMIIRASRYPGVSTPAPTRPKTRLTDFYPRSMDGLDVSDPLVLHFVFSEDASMHLDQSHGKHFAQLTPLVSGGSRGARVVVPHTQFFEDTNQFAVTFPPYALRWGTRYQLTVDGSVLRPASDEATHFDVAEVVSANAIYSTATCGCIGGFCASGGACPCVEQSNEECNACQPGFHLTAHRRTIGSGTLATQAFVCVSRHHHSPVPSSQHPKTPEPSSFLTTDVPSDSPLAPPKGSPRDNLPVTTNGGTETRPPLHTLRYALAYSSLVILVWYTAWFFVKHRIRSRHAFQNPFRPAETGTLGLDSDEDAPTTEHDALSPENGGTLAQAAHPVARRSATLPEPHEAIAMEQRRPNGFGADVGDDDDDDDFFTQRNESAPLKK
jgi:hypothetical protein